MHQCLPPGLPPGITEIKQLGYQTDSSWKLETPMSGAHMNLDFPTVRGSCSPERMQQIGKTETALAHPAN